MADLISFTSIADAILKGKQAVKGSFTLETRMDGNSTTNEKNYIQMFNANWSTKSQPLTSQITKFLFASYKAEGCLMMSSKWILD